MKKPSQWWDQSINVVTGCTPVSEGCKNCWAKGMCSRFPKAHGSEDFGHVRVHLDRLERLKVGGKPKRFALSFLGDLFHPDVPNAVINETYAACLKSLHSCFVLTKRAARLHSWCHNFSGEVFESSSEHPHRSPYGENVWFGVTVENQERADERIPFLNDCVSSVGEFGLFVHIEPMLGPIEFRAGWLRYIEWVVVGGETGPHARPCNPDWIRSIRDQCKEAGVPMFLKQLGKPKDRQCGGCKNYLPGQDQCLILRPQFDPDFVACENFKPSTRRLDGETFDYVPGGAK